MPNRTKNQPPRERSATGAGLGDFFFFFFFLVFFFVLFGASTPIGKAAPRVNDPLLLAGLLYLGSGSPGARDAVGRLIWACAFPKRRLARPRPALAWRSCCLAAFPVLPCSFRFSALHPASRRLPPAQQIASPRWRFLAGFSGERRSPHLSGAPWRSSPARHCSLAGRRITRPHLDWAVFLSSLPVIAWGHRQHLTPPAQCGRPAASCDGPPQKGLAAVAVKCCAALARGAPLPVSPRLPPGPHLVSSATLSSCSLYSPASFSPDYHEAGGVAQAVDRGTIRC